MLSVGVVGGGGGGGWLQGLLALGGDFVEGFGFGRRGGAGGLGERNGGGMVLVRGLGAALFAVAGDGDGSVGHCGGFFDLGAC